MAANDPAGIKEQHFAACHSGQAGRAAKRGRNQTSLMDYTGIFDTHAHYDDSAFDEDRDSLIQSLPGKGISLVADAYYSMLDVAFIDDSVQISFV